jgi:hypothetical protein
MLSAAEVISGLTIFELSSRTAFSREGSAVISSFVAGQTTADSSLRSQ